MRRVRTWLSALTDDLGETLESAHSLEDVSGMDQRVSLITLAVDDMGRAAAFYVALGWRRWEFAWNPFSPLGPAGEFQWNGAA